MFSFVDDEKLLIMPNGETMDSSENTEIQPEPSPPNGVPMEVPLEEEPPNQNERELTQTDHLNKSLLTAFLGRLNDPNFTIPQQHMQSTEATEGSQTNDEHFAVERNGDGSHHGNETDGRGKGDAWNDKNDGDEK